MASSAKQVAARKKFLAMIKAKQGKKVAPKAMKAPKATKNVAAKKK